METSKTRNTRTETKSSRKSSGYTSTADTQYTADSVNEPAAGAAAVDYDAIRYRRDLHDADFTDLQSDILSQARSEDGKAFNHAVVDLQNDVQEVRGEMAELRTAIVETRGEMRTAIAELRGEVRVQAEKTSAQIAEVRVQAEKSQAEIAEMRVQVEKTSAQIADLRTEMANMKSDIIKFVCTFIIGMSTVQAMVILAFVHFFADTPYTADSVNEPPPSAVGAAAVDRKGNY